MARTVISRIPDTKSLYDILPKGVEGGKEFARVIDLLLFHAARRDGTKVGLFSDASGDFTGLDSFEGDRFRTAGTIGYQYKFFPSPLTSAHRAEIKKALAIAADKSQKLKLTKWILVTPQDLLESSTKVGGGDVTWFEELRSELDLEFEIEHWGHRKIQGLFIDTPSLCLFYYPELVREGSKLKRTIQDTRRRYDENFQNLHRRIEFVGMSVYKQEATKGVPMEHIYIPVLATPDGAGSPQMRSSQTDPLTFLSPGKKSVVLGDPGSGKSTMLRFLALAGMSVPLQRRYHAQPDDRLPVLVVLRRYADELKTRRNLPLLDYIRDVAAADFALNSADTDFFEYFLESGRSILMFDGLDELPNPALKEIVRDRIRGLVTTYPGNTTIVTSRIVGYDQPFRFEENEFLHFRLSPLGLPEMEQFVIDWYRVRVEHAKEQQDNSSDLVRILRDDTHTAIRELARNPLLLTIIALVHRIDAVLPDERIVLYQKCTETLLNTWHSWKFRGSDTQRRGRIERRNRQRVEAIAYWMHSRAKTNVEGHRAVVQGEDLLIFLSKHITENERLQAGDDDAQDQAVDFLDFIKKRAGLLIEVGDEQYSFVHLTFQEFLTASYIATKSETGGADAIWNYIRKYRGDPGWHEVIRLLVATMKADETQELLLEKFLDTNGHTGDLRCARLLGGLLLDGIEAAEDKSNHIFDRLLMASCHAAAIEDVKAIVQTLSACKKKSVTLSLEVEDAFGVVWARENQRESQVKLWLTLQAAGWHSSKIREITGNFETLQDPIYRIFLDPEELVGEESPLPTEMFNYLEVMQTAALTSPGDNLIASTFPAVALAYGGLAHSQMLFALLLTVFPNLSSPGHGPVTDLSMNFGLLAAAADKFAVDVATAMVSARTRRIRRQNHIEANYSLLADALRFMEPNTRAAQDRALEQASPSVEIPASVSTKSHNVTTKAQRARVGSPDFLEGRTKVAKKDTSTFAVQRWSEICGSAAFQQKWANLFFKSLKLEPRSHWEIALRERFLPSVPNRIMFLSERRLNAVAKALAGKTPTESDVYAAAWLILLKIWMQINEVVPPAFDKAVSKIISLAKAKDSAPLKVAECLFALSKGDKLRIAEWEDIATGSDPSLAKLLDLGLWTRRERRAHVKTSRRAAVRTKALSSRSKK